MALAERANSGLHAHVLGRIDAIRPGHDAVILDIGCGTGAFLARLREQGYEQLIGMDIAPPAPFDGIRFIEADFDQCNTSLPDASVEIATAIEVIEHVENVGTLLAELNRILVPGGKVLLTTPNVHSVEARVRFLLNDRLKQFDSVGDPTHVYPVFRFPFERLLARYRFAVVECWGFPSDGSSPTSRPGLRALAKFARALGIKGGPPGDQLCYLLERARAEPFNDTGLKREALTAHY